MTKDSDVKEFKSYPYNAPTYNRAKKNQALEIKKKMFLCNRSQLKAFREEQKYSSDQIDWVWEHCLTNDDKKFLNFVIEDW